MSGDVRGDMSEGEMSSPMGMSYNRTAGGGVAVSITVDVLSKARGVNAPRRG